MADITLTAPKPACTESQNICEIVLPEKFDGMSLDGNKCTTTKDHFDCSGIIFPRVNKTKISYPTGVRSGTLRFFNKANSAVIQTRLPVLAAQKLVITNPQFAALATQARNQIRKLGADISLYDLFQEAVPNLLLMGEKDLARTLLDQVSKKYPDSGELEYAEATYTTYVHPEKIKQTYGAPDYLKKLNIDPETDGLDLYRLQKLGHITHTDSLRLYGTKGSFTFSNAGYPSEWDHEQMKKWLSTNTVPLATLQSWVAGGAYDMIKDLCIVLVEVDRIQDALALLEQVAKEGSSVEYICEGAIYALAGKGLYSTAAKVIQLIPQTGPHPSDFRDKFTRTKAWVYLAGASRDLKWLDQAKKDLKNEKLPQVEEQKLSRALDQLYQTVSSGLDVQKWGAAFKLFEPHDTFCLFGFRKWLASDGQLIAVKNAALENNSPAYLSSDDEEVKIILGRFLKEDKVIDAINFLKTKEKSHSEILDIISDYLISKNRLVEAKTFITTAGYYDEDKARALLKLAQKSQQPTDYAEALKTAGSLISEMRRPSAFIQILAALKGTSTVDLSTSSLSHQKNDSKLQGDRPKPVRVDTDQDGVPDFKDKCPKHAHNPSENPINPGCPAIPE